MPSPPSHPPNLDPLLPLARLAHSLTTAVLHLLLGLLLGLPLAHLMRRRHLHWSWAATVLVFLVLSQGALTGIACTLAAAALAAAFRGRRWHHEDLHAGGDLGDIARQRLTPLDALRFTIVRLARSCTRLLAGRLARRPAVLHGWLAGLLSGLHSGIGEGKRERLVVGCDQRDRAVSIPLHEPAGGGVHTLVVGATGSGKTVTQTWIAVNAVQRGMAVVAIDPKGDRMMRAELQRAARIAGVPLLEWTPQGPSVYNPFAHGTPTEIADKALAGERFTEPHYLRQAQRYLGHELRTLHGLGIEASFAQLVLHLDPLRLEALARGLRQAEAGVVHDYLDSLTQRQISDLSGVRDRLAILAESDVARWLDPHTPGLRPFHLLHTLRRGAVVYFDLHSDQRPLLAQMLGAAIVQDLQTAAARLQARPVPALILIDEFSALAAEQVARLFGRARSAGMSLLLGTQELSDLRLPGQERLHEQVLGNLTTLIAHRQTVPDSAELVARLAGTRGTWSTSLSSTGRRTRTRSREYRLRPDHIARLPRAHAAVLSLADEDHDVRIARMFSPQR